MPDHLDSALQRLATIAADPRLTQAEAAVMARIAAPATATDAAFGTRFSMMAAAAALALGVASAGLLTAPTRAELPLFPGMALAPSTLLATSK